MPSKGHEHTAKIHAEQVFTRGYSDGYEKEYIRKDRTFIPVSVSAWLIKDKEGKTTGRRTMVHDLTGRKKLDPTKTDFINVAVHELRTPLSALKARTDLLKIKSKDMNRPGDINRRIAIIARNADRLISLINDILDFRRIEAGTIKLNRELGSLKTVASQSIKEILPLAKKCRHELNLPVPKKLPFIYMDKEITHRIFTNLLSNAIKYTPDGGRIDVTILEEEDNLHVTVQDTGIGIAEDDLENIFQPYHLADISESVLRVSEFERTGLGLVLTKEYVKMHSGTIWAESQIGEGSTFHVLLPKKRNEVKEAPYNYCLPNIASNTNSKQEITSTFHIP